MIGDIMPLPQEKIDELYQAATTGDVAIPATDIQCLLSLEKEWSMTQPFAGKTILFNQHLKKNHINRNLGALKSGRRCSRDRD